MVDIANFNSYAYNSGIYFMSWLFNMAADWKVHTFVNK